MLDAVVAGRCSMEVVVGWRLSSAGYWWSLFVVIWMIFSELTVLPTFSTGGAQLCLYCTLIPHIFDKIILSSYIMPISYVFLVQDAT